MCGPGVADASRRQPSRLACGSNLRGTPCPQALLAPPWQVAGLLPGEQAGLRHRGLGSLAAGFALPPLQCPASGPCPLPGAPACLPVTACLPATHLFRGRPSCAVPLRDLLCSWPVLPAGASLGAPCSGKRPDFTLFRPSASLSVPEPTPARWLRRYHLGAILLLAVQPGTWIDFEGCQRPCEGVCPL